MSATIWLTQGYYTLVDEQDYKWACQWNWWVKWTKYTNYAIRKHQINGKRKVIWMHNILLTERMGLIIPKGFECDHKDRNGLNNQRDNLRIVTRSINNFNKGIMSTNTSGIIGVSYCVERKKWRTEITINSKKYYLGRFESRNKAEAIYINAKRNYLEHGILPSRNQNHKRS